ncbi:hypothetical protein [Nibribacter koreensis]|uniref:Uncharacterized protein n=1 Tax=Nibribacter koreensis TaxID=1084519 RepID=A0ABP8FB21_9BACT
MRAKVLKSFIDRLHNGKRRATDEVFSLTAERLEELEGGGFVARVTDPKKRKQKPGADRLTKEDKTPLDTK